MTLMKAFGDFQKGQYSERNFRFGVREHGMGAIANGLAHHHSGLIPYCATFFIFTGGRHWRSCHSFRSQRNDCRCAFLQSPTQPSLATVLHTLPSLLKPSLALTLG